MVEEKLKEELMAEIARLKAQEDSIREVRQQLESRLRSLYIKTPSEDASDKKRPSPNKQGPVSLMGLLYRGKFDPTCSLIKYCRVKRGLVVER